MQPSTKRRGRPPYFTPQQEQQLLELSQQQPELSMHQLAQRWVELYDPERTPPGTSTIERVLRRHRYQYQSRPKAQHNSSQPNDQGKEARYLARHRAEPVSGYPSDLTDAQWKLVAPLLERPGKRGPRPTDSRNTLNAILYMSRTGCQWRYLPKDFGKWNSIAKTYYRWKQSGVIEELHSILRRQIRIQEGRQDEPSMTILDSQSVKTTEKGGLAATMAARR